MRRVLGITACAALVAGCGQRINPQWCNQPDHSDDPACEGLSDKLTDASVDAPVAPACTRSSDCAGPNALCLPDGTCGSDSSTLYASPDGDGQDCTSTAKCSLATAIAQVTDERNVIILEPAVYTGGLAIDRSMKLIGNRATLRAGSAGPALAVNNAILQISDLSITGAVEAGINCMSGVLRASQISVFENLEGITSACALTLERSVIRNNPNGAVTATGGTINIRNNFIVHNGNPMLGGKSNVHIAGDVTGTFAFNTVAYNDAKQNNDPGVDCRNAGISAPGNLVTDNTRRGSFGVDNQVVGTCNFGGSFIQPGTGNNDMRWVDVTTADFHLTAASTALVNTADVSCEGQTDIDGDARPIDGRCDYGADELR